MIFALAGIANCVRGPADTIRPSRITTAPSGTASAPVPSISMPLVSDSASSARWAELHPISRLTPVALVSLRKSRLDIRCGLSFELIFIDYFSAMKSQIRLIPFYLEFQCHDQILTRSLILFFHSSNHNIVYCFQPLCNCPPSPLLLS